MSMHAFEDLAWDGPAAPSAEPDPQDPTTGLDTAPDTAPDPAPTPAPAPSASAPVDPASTPAASDPAGASAPTGAPAPQTGAGGTPPPQSAPAPAAAPQATPQATPAPAAPGAGTTPGPAPTQPAPADAQAQPEEAKPVDPKVYQRRRRSAGLLVLCGLVLGVVHFGLLPGASGAVQQTSQAAKPASSPAPTGAANSPAGQTLSGQLRAAAAYQASYGTYVGFTPTQGVQVVEGTGTLVLSTVDAQGRCWFTGILAGRIRSVLQDTSYPAANSACDPAFLAKEQDSVRAQESAAVGAASAKAAARLASAADAAQFYARMHVTAAGASLTGLPSLGADVQATVDPSGTEATLAVPVGNGVCLRVQVPAAGPVPASAPGPCPA